MKAKLYIIISLLLTASLLPQQALADADKAKLLSSEDDNSPEAQKYAKLVDIYTEALEKDDVPLHVKCLNDIIKYCHESNQPKREADAISTRVVYFYNRSLDDSLAKYAPQDLKVLKQYKNWKRYYELWTYLANSYLYSGKPNLALREAQAMFEDAKNRDNQLGMGLSYYTMGSIYTTLNVLDESINNYQKGLDILSTIRPYPSNLAELYSYYCDVLNMKQDYHTLEKVTKQWNDFLQKYLTEGRFDQETVNTFYCNYFIACAQASMGLGKLEQADEQMKKAKDNLNADTDFTHLSWLLNMAKLRYQQGRYMEALEFNNRRYSLSSQMDDAPSLVDVVKQRAEIFQRLGRYKESTQFFQRLYQLTDSINVQDTKSQLNEMNTLFKVDELKMAQERELYELNMKREREQFRLMMIIVGGHRVGTGYLHRVPHPFSTTEESPRPVATDPRGIADGLRPTGRDNYCEGTYRERPAYCTRYSAEYDSTEVPTVPRAYGHRPLCVDDTCQGGWWRPLRLHPVGRETLLLSG